MGKSQYAEIVDALVGDLAGRRPGARFASEHEIAARFAGSRAVAGAALRELESRLLVRRVRGSGTFVNGRIDYVISAHRPPPWHPAGAPPGAQPAVGGAVDPPQAAARRPRGPPRTGARQRGALRRQAGLDQRHA